jgi:Fe-S-cluster-containing hydrogenase component 2
LACAMENFSEVRPSLAVLRIKGLFPAPGTYRIQVCDQCGACAEACPVEAIAKQNGVYRVRQEACTQCLECVEACPYGVMCTHPALDTPFKCTLCEACVQACPRGALVLVDEARGAEEG